MMRARLSRLFFVVAAWLDARLVPKPAPQPRPGELEEAASHARFGAYMSGKR